MKKISNGISTIKKENQTLRYNVAYIIFHQIFVRDGIHSDADYNSSRVGVGVVIVVVVVVVVVAILTMG